MNISICIRQIFGIAYLTSRWIKRQPTWLLQSVLSYIGFAILLYAWGGITGLKNLIIAMLISGFWSVGVNIVGQEIGWARISGTQDMFIASPIKPLHFVIGIFIMSLIFPLIDLIALIPIVYILNAWNIMILALVIGLPVLLIGIMLGLIIVMRIRTPVNVSAITNPISWLLTILPPVYYPAWIIPEPARYIALTIPTSASAEIVRQLIGMGTSVPLWYPVIVVVLWITIGILTASKTIRWGLE